MRGFGNRQPSVVSQTVWFPRGNAASGLAMTSGARLIDSTPPATNRSPSPAATAWHAPTTAERPGRAQPVDRDARDRLRQAREQRRHAGDVAVVLAGLVGAAEVDVLDLARVDAGALDRLLDRRARRGRRAASRRARRRSARPACERRRGRRPGSRGSRPRHAAPAHRRNSDSTYASSPAHADAHVHSKVQMYASPPGSSGTLQRSHGRASRGPCSDASRRTRR